MSADISKGFGRVFGSGASIDIEVNDGVRISFGRGAVTGIGGAVIGKV